MLNEFFEINTFHIDPEEGVQLALVPERLRGETLDFDLADDDHVIVEAGKRITARHVKQLADSGIAALAVPDTYLIGRILSHDVIDAATGDLPPPANDAITEETLQAFTNAGLDHAVNSWSYTPHRGSPLANPLPTSTPK